MKLSEHVKTIRELIYSAFVNQFARLGITAETQRDLALDPEAMAARNKLDAIIANHIEETGSYQGAYEKALDEYTFTLFNRLAALKVMESHRMFPEVITKRVENGGRSFGHRAWLEENPAMAADELEGLLPYIRDAFDALGREIRLYSQESTYDMLPFVLDLNVIIGAVNAVEEDKDVGAEIWQSDDIMGWLYESYNLSKKQAFKDSGAKIEFDKVSLTSQIYTPRWVVEFLVNNSLGKLYLEMYPDSEIKRRYKIANAPASRVRTPKSLHEIRLIDPATGSANFLLYAFDFFYALYQDQIDNYGEDYEEDDIPKLIIENNLYGVDLDDRAIQIAQLGLYIKALRKNSRVHIEKFNVVSSDFYLPDFDVVAESFTDSLAKDPLQKQLIKEIWADLQGAYQFGSLIRVEERFNAKFGEIYEKMKAPQGDIFATGEYLSIEKFKDQFFSDLHNAVSVYSQKSGNAFLQSKSNDAITFLEILIQKYDVAVANPPYTDSGDFGSELKGFIEENYKKPHGFHTNLYATFIKRCLELTKDDGLFATIHPHTFMFIKTFEGVREYIINSYHIDLLVDYGQDRINLFRSDISLDATFYILRKNKLDQPSVFLNITENIQEKNKYGVLNDVFNNLLGGTNNPRIFTINQDKLKVINSYPFIYWLSDIFREKFSGGGLSKYYKDINVGMQIPGGNERYLRLWWEHNLSDAYMLYSKGGAFKKWYGNLWLTVPKNILHKLSSTETNRQKLLAVTCGRQSSKGVSFRIKYSDTLVDNGTMNLFLKKETEAYFFLGLLNSKVSSYVFRCLNPTVNKQAGDLKRIPNSKPESEILSSVTVLSKACVEINKKLGFYSIVESFQFKSPLLMFPEMHLNFRLLCFLSYENHLLTQVLLNEAIINEKIFEVYELTPEDKEMVLAKEGKTIGGFPVLSEARSAYLADIEATKEFPLDNIRAFIESLPAFTLDTLQISELFAKFENLYQSNNDLEEFCIRNQINPINVWYLFKQSGVLPVQRTKTIALEFLADIVREILNEDNDGVVPLVRNAGEEILLDRIEKKFIEKGFSSAQYSTFPTILGKELNEYLNNNFFPEFSNLLNPFRHLPMTPFIWHITSGQNRGFDAFVIIYKWNRDKLYTLKSVYIEKREAALLNRQSDLLNEKTAQAENEKDLIFHQLKEIESLKKKIDELLAEGYDPKLDDGVGKNIAPLQKKGMLAYEVLNAGQLKKYLNADW
ncbi:N-6 DNA methylase [Nitrosomonas sp.]|uniref:Eco57I restriction-modification methylase domain-containing protein n=1 Tax=Nitrosomonas sp. TaxID=42353 RepID=UPI001E16037D|nr:N-6 DNA methylase [Nitrosomonas sp.]MBX9637026.1 N-6 DNA methylase [Nitrosomonas sp.]MBY0484541.1 N-6 DNA methylase [Nitrosomonas sp.]